MRHIQHSAFLSRGYRSFSQIGGSLFIYGHSLAGSDEHILKRIEKGKVRNVYVSIFGNPKSKDNQRVITRALAMIAARESSGRRNGLKVQFYDAGSPNVWSST